MTGNVRVSNWYITEFYKSIELVTEFVSDCKVHGVIPWVSGDLVHEQIISILKEIDAKQCLEREPLARSLIVPDLPELQFYMVYNTKTRISKIIMEIMHDTPIS